MTLQTLLAEMVERNTSDLHLCADAPPYFRCPDGSLAPRKDTENLDGPALETLLQSALTEAQWKGLSEAGETTAILTHQDRLFRCQAFRSRGHWGAVIRAIPPRIPSLQDLNLPPVIEQLTHAKRGLILLTGPVGSGKSTTLMAMLDHINQTRAERIVTVENMLEYVLLSRQSLVTQQIIGMDVETLAQGVNIARDLDPDIIFLGYLMTPEAIDAALSFVETGHLVFGLSHSPPVSHALSRLVELCPHSRDLTRQRLAESIEAVIAQFLLPRADRSGRAAANEILLATPEVRAAIADGQSDLTPIMAGNPKIGMQTMDEAVLKRYRAGTITYETAQGVMRDKKQLGEK